MTINLSETMIEQVMYVAYGRICDLKQKKKTVQESKLSARRKTQQLKDIDTAILEAREVHSLFVELAEQI